MDWNPDSWLAPRQVSTSDIVADVTKYIDKSFTSDALDQMLPEFRRKLIVLVERLEFIEHLSIVTQMLLKHKNTTVSDTPLGNGIAMRIETYSIVIGGHDFAGFDFDTDALILYLLLTCIDTLKGQGRYKNAFQWIMERKPADFLSEWEILQHQYEQEYGLSKKFREAFLLDCSREIKTTLTRNLAVVKLGRQCIKDESAQAWNKRTDEEKLKRIASQLWTIRSQFTHRSLRTFSCDMPVRNSLEVKGSVLLRRVEGPSLSEMIMKLIVYLTKSLVLKQVR